MRKLTQRVRCDQMPIILPCMPVEQNLTREVGNWKWVAICFSAQPVYPTRPTASPPRIPLSPLHWKHTSGCNLHNRHPRFSGHVDNLTLNLSLPPVCLLCGGAPECPVLCLKRGWLQHHPYGVIRRVKWVNIYSSWCSGWLAANPYWRVTLCTIAALLFSRELASPKFCESGLPSTFRQRGWLFITLFKNEYSHIKDCDSNAVSQLTWACFGRRDGAVPFVVPLRWVWVLGL